MCCILKEFNATSDVCDVGIISVLIISLFATSNHIKIKLYDYTIIHEWFTTLRDS